MSAKNVMSSEAHGRPVTNSLGMVAVRDAVLSNLSDFVEWPRAGRLWAPGVVRNREHHRILPDDFVAEAKRAGATSIRLHNGPAVAAYVLAGGQLRTDSASNRPWQVHHIYDGKFPRGAENVLHAAKEPQHFTHSAGLVRLHPVAHALADSDAEFAWYLRDEARKRFGYAPDASATNAL